MNVLYIMYQNAVEIYYPIAKKNPDYKAIYIPYLKLCYGYYF